MISIKTSRYSYQEISALREILQVGYKNLPCPYGRNCYNCESRRLCRDLFNAISFLSKEEDAAFRKEEDSVLE